MGTILMPDTDTMYDHRRCAACPQEFYFLPDASQEQIEAELEAHTRICPGRQAEASAA
ncbi:MAG: hypothetical protein HY231_24120 [Acidobacteria bacterium]|nr:hypothetical protein [Acidobacteriota bacterium]